MLTLNVGDYRVEVTDDLPHEVESADNLNSYDSVHVLEGSTNLWSSWHGLRLFQHEDLIRSCLVKAGGGATGVHDHSAILCDSNCIIAVGPFIASVAVPSLELNWATETDDATCLGVYESPGRDCLLSHGELLIARVTFGGKIEWQAGGADIFTNGFELDGDVIRVRDFNGRDYVFGIETGREVGA